MSEEVIKNLLQVRSFKVRKDKLFDLWFSVALQEIGKPPMCVMKWDEFKECAENNTLTCFGKPIIIIE